MVEYLVARPPLLIILAFAIIIAVFSAFISWTERKANRKLGMGVIRGFFYAYYQFASILIGIFLSCLVAAGIIMIPLILVTAPFK